MKINGTWVFLTLLLALMGLGFVLLFMVGTHYVGGGSYMDNLAEGQAAYGKEVSVVVVNLREDGALDTEAALFKGELYLLMQVLDNKTRIFFNDLSALQTLDEYQQNMVSANNAVYKNLEVGQFSRAGKAFNEEGLEAAGIRALELYSEPRQKEKYGQVIGEVVMANGNRYPLQIVNIESKYLGQS